MRDRDHLRREIEARLTLYTYLLRRVPYPTRKQTYPVSSLPNADRSLSKQDGQQQT
jgi:hypothetical protein